MKCLVHTLLASLLLCFVLVPPVTAGDFVALCYHGIEDRVTEDPDAMQVSTDNLIGQLNWLRENGWQAVSIDELLAARAGERALPDRAFLLTFDDGYADFYTRVLPVLKAFRMPAVLALMTGWLETPADQPVSYGDAELPRSAFLTWEQLREIRDSGLVEIASHSDNLHRGLLGNPQGNLQPALTTRSYLPDEQRYESEAEWRARIRADLARSQQIIARELGQKPRVMVWPYGAYNAPAQGIAAELGMEISLTLDARENRLDRLDAVARRLVDRDLDPAGFTVLLREPPQTRIRRVAHVDLDYVYDPDPQQQERNLGQLLDRIKALQINTVFLQAYADPDGDGAASALYFPNRQLPMRADLFNRVAWQLRTRAQVEVFAWLPLLAFDLDGRKVARFAGADDGGHPPRLSPFDSDNRRRIAGIYRDLAAHAQFSGILFSDDGLLDDFEDAGAIDFYRDTWGLPANLAEIRADAALEARFSRLKTRFLIDFSQELLAAARVWRPQLQSARNLFARPVLEPHSEAWFAQNLVDFVAAYDWVALMAMPWMEQAKRPLPWLRELVTAVKQTPGALEKTLFELQAVDWNPGGGPLPTALLAEQMEVLLEAGAVSYGYYPENFIAGHPQLERLKQAISLSEFPYSRR